MPYRSECRIAQGGESFYLASNVPHGVETMEDTMVLDTFSPPRDDYLALDEQARANSERAAHCGSSQRR